MVNIEVSGSDLEDGEPIDNLEIEGGVVKLEEAYPSILENADHHWKFDEGSGDTVEDSISGYDGEISGASWEEDDGLGDAYLAFDGSSDRVELPDDTLSDVSTWTKIAWIRTTSSSGSQRVHGKRNGDSRPAYQVGAENGDMYGRVSGPDDTRAEIETSQSIDDGEWYMHTWVTGEEEVHLYLNDELLDSGSHGGDLEQIDQETWIGGEARNDRMWDGDIDNAIYIESAATEEEIEEVYEYMAENYS
ncbi:LamG-like jellyroll fold domain-containing protein [Natronorubrum daqingense]|uniref:Concanavalin A-like lectin/glucanases superfamily protein n=1 Tax=Natronorubrum daqingense TaxID=588898 RepID=A0A1N7FXS7_9EURY|nr:LamG-like jellyroll fold domain-containing protein [Natronorubrum daqingense]APX98547.1 hypothetical protein BB347_17735 [Natronorubrum daqingense]SIS05158.1 Concanavalin A-like lectin/glucanases superfamily protein [Natronorubrum daqingense]